MSRSSNKRLRELGANQGLDGGGYEFTNPPRALSKHGCVMWDNPGLCVVPWAVGDKPRGDWYGLACPMYVFSPSGEFSYVHEGPPWPEWFQHKGWKYYKVREGSLQETEAACDCEATDPECAICCGDGYFTREGGRWAVYAVKER